MAIKQLDIGLTDDDLTIKAGDFVSVESTLEHQRQLVGNGKGDFKENPTICVGADDYIDDDPGFPELIREISKQFTDDGMTVQSIKLLPDGTLESNADYQ